MINLHNDEMPEYLETQAEDEPTLGMMRKLSENLVAKTSFDPTKEIRPGVRPDHTTTSLYQERRIPVLTMEQRIGTNRKLAAIMKPTKTTSTGIASMG